MGDIDKQKLVTTNSLRIFSASLFTHPSPEILTKHNIKENAIKGNL